MTLKRKNWSLTSSTTQLRLSYMNIFFKILNQLKILMCTSRLRQLKYHL